MTKNRMRRPRTSVRVFSKPEFAKCEGKLALLVGVHKNRKLAEKQIDTIGDWRIESSCITKSKRGYKTFVRLK